MYTVYGKDGCSACVQACHTLMMKGEEVTYKKLGKDYDLEDLTELLVERNLPPPRTFPQIFKQDENGVMYVGGFTELKKSLE